MPAKKKSDSSKREKITDWKSIKWCLNNLDEATLEKIDATPFDTEKYLEWIDLLTDNGFEVKLGWDNWSECYSATATCIYKGFDNSGYAVSARSPEGYADCIKILWGKIEFVAQGDLKATYEKPSKKSKRG